MGTRRCLGCMREITEDTVRCPYCDFSKDDLLPLNSLPLKTVLNSRYVVGKPFKIDGEGFTYIAYDGKTTETVVIREYLPQELANREYDIVDAKPGCEAKFKALKSDFRDLYLALIQLHELENINKVIDIFEANNTVYAVCEHIEGITLNQYIIENAGELDWDETKELFRPLLESLSVVHNRGILHRGISPQTIVITPGNTLKLIDFSICSARTSHSEISAEMYDGYAAPEQYISSEPHGEWTDVYAVCAVLYKVLTGTMPPVSVTRHVNDNLIAISQLNDTVPERISNAVINGMELDHSRRCASMKRLIDGLYQPEKMDSTILMSFSSENQADRIQQTVAFVTDGASAKKQTSGKKKLPLWATVLLICIPIVIGVTILLYGLMIGFGNDDRPKQKDDGNSMISSEVSGESNVEESEASEDVSEEESSQAEQHVVDNFVGKMYDNIIATTEYTDLYTFKTPIYEYNDGFGVGEVFDQSIEPDTLAEEGVEITLSVSMGPRYITLPSTSGYTAKEYAQMLVDEYSISAKVADEKEYSDTVLPGYIVRVEPGIDEMYDVETGKTVTVYESMGQDPMKEVSQTPETVE